jgi:tight adherence protein C
MLESLTADPKFLVSVLTFLAATTIAFAVMVAVQAREAVRRRAARVNSQADADHRRGLQHSGLRAAQRILDYANAHYVSIGAEDLKVLRKRLVHAGIYNPQATAYFFLARGICAAAFAAVTGFIMSLLLHASGASFWLFIMCGGVAGYLTPGIYLDKRTAAMRLQYRYGFPDFMDLLVVSSDAGLSLEAALDRVRRELSGPYPALAANIHMTNLEIRAGRTMTEALEHFADRLGLDEAHSFATLIKQSDELGSSIGDALRVYSDDMRHKRLSRAEEKAHSLPAKLTIPMMVCVFPVLFIVILCPVIVRLVTNNW